MALRDYFPLQQGSAIRERRKRSSTIVSLDDKNTLQKAFKVSFISLASNSSFISDRKEFEEPEHDFERISNAIDTDSYAKRAFSKYRELFWKEGWEIVGENPEAVSYLYQRFDFMELAMGKPIQDFFEEVTNELFKFHNCFTVEKRGDLAPYFPGRLTPPTGLEPILGYYIIPTETVQIKRNKHNKPQKYLQRIDSTGDYMASNRKGVRREPTWFAKEVIHFSRDKRPGKAFGTPFVEAALDDIASLRQVEEDILNLIHRDLFPLYKYTVGTDQQPSQPEDIDGVVNTIEELRTDGAIVLPHTHDVDVIGGDNNALDANPYLKHFKERVAVGLGVFPHHLGMVDTGANKDMTDRLDISLYDSIKDYQRYFSQWVRMNIFDKLLFEGGFNPVDNPHLSGVSDRCLLKFNEIDVDTQIKKETHIANLASQNLIDIAEARLQLKLDPELDESNTTAALQVRMQPDQPVTTKSADGSAGTQMVDVTPTPAQKGAPNPSKNGKGSANIIKPTNQHGTRTSPNVRHSELIPGWLEEVEDLLED